MSRVEESLGEMGVTLPKLPMPLANYAPAKRTGNLVFTVGQVSPPAHYRSAWLALALHAGSMGLMSVTMGVAMPS